MSQASHNWWPFSIKLLAVVLYFHRTEYWNFLVCKSCCCELDERYLNLNWLAFEIRKQPVTSALLRVDFWELVTCCVVVDFWLGSTVYQSQHQFVVIGIWKCQKVGNFWPNSLCFVCLLLCYAFFFWKGEKVIRLLSVLTFCVFQLLW